MSYQPPPNHGLNCVYVDDFLIVVNKPAGLLSVPGRGVEKQDCLWSRVGEVYTDVRTVHRLDMGTSGLVVLARGVEMERALSIQFQKRLVSKKYQALVTGNIYPSQGAIDLPLLTDWPNRPRQKVDFLNGKPSQTLYQKQWFDPDRNISGVDLQPLTGRSHQLRVHLASLGHAILGDELYAIPEVYQQSTRLLLHAYYLGFTHPITANFLSFYAPAQDFFMP
ncbi:pseudouridine synthase [Thiolinea disciformis]|uniref:pseudouridine synthase n=1 Tax=Thiolinea disciformis TaxID=125614 RepID=UPI000365A3DC|nr:pseudouridine synthase [Thiolinea disciformis]